MAALPELESCDRVHDDQWVVIVTTEITGDTSRRVSTQLDELARTSGQSG